MRSPCALLVTSNTPNHNLADLEPLAERLGPENLARRSAERPARPLRWIARRCRSVVQRALLLSFFKIVGKWKQGRLNFTQIQRRSNELAIPGLPAPFDGFRLLQLSDLHFNLAPDLLGPAIRDAIDGLDYDACVITGDLVNTPPLPGEADGLAALLGQIRQPLYGCLGNRDSLELVFWFEANGLRVLLNEAIPIERDGIRVWLAGVDNTIGEGAPDLPRAMRTVPSGAVTVLLAHSPDYAETAAGDARIRAMLCGHTHGGQICLPGGRPISINCPCPPERGAGPWRHGRLQGYTSRGTGGGGVPVRFNCPPEVTIHTLRTPGLT